ncbi:transglutaminase family protein [Aquimarina sp. D1M17]|uniref:transglutaminase-like domain-containing protein n=1 Tax=Aquimarina acroporae TaxID=2937283 RepID=UPI0020C028AC|nr:transglutaminase family protein [Aquimarina acroporae]MCK8520634.1 transglutaminase family protein [Aquimarina acroporae]
MNYITTTYFLNYDSPEIQELIEEFKTNSLTLQEKAVGLYYKVRDQWRYDPYQIHLTKEGYKASNIARKSFGHCVDKSILLIAGLRGLGIPARIHLAKVKNHIAVEKLTEKFGTNELTPHGMVNIYLNGKWVKASPAFNKTLCEKCNVAPLEFDGEEDSMFQEYDSAGNVFMEYLEDYGHFEDVPFDFMIENMKTHYPELVSMSEGLDIVKI